MLLGPATRFQPGLTGQVELGLNSYGPLVIGNKNLILPLSLTFVQRFTTDNGKQPTSGFRLQAVADPTRHRMLDKEYVRYTLQQKGRFAADLDLFVEGSPVADFSVNAHAGAGLRFYPLFADDDNDKYHFYETYEQLVLYFGGGFAYRLRRHDSPRTAWGLLEGGLDYRKNWPNFSTRSLDYYRQEIGPNTRFSSLQAQVAFTGYLTNKTGLQLSGNWYGRPAGDPQTKYFDVRLGIIFHLSKSELVRGRESKPQTAGREEAQKGV